MTLKVTAKCAKPIQSFSSIPSGTPGYFWAFLLLSAHVQLNSCVLQLNHYFLGDHMAGAIVYPEAWDGVNSGVHHRRCFRLASTLASGF